MDINKMLAESNDSNDLYDAMLIRERSAGSGLIATTLPPGAYRNFYCGIAA